MAIRCICKRATPKNSHAIAELLLSQNMMTLHLVPGGSPLKLSSSPPSITLYHIPTSFNLSCNRKCMIKMSIQSTPSAAINPTNNIVLGCGMVALDFLVTVDSYPKPDDKIRSTSFLVQGGGNTGNALTCAARLGLTPRIISKVADDSQGKRILNELKADGIDTSFIVVSEGGHSTISYVIVDSQTKTRTSIYTPGYPPMVSDDLPDSSLLSALDGVKLVYTDGVLHETALVVAQEAHRRSKPIVIDAERKIEGLDELLNMATYLVCSTRFPQIWTEASSIPGALISILLKLPSAKFVIGTLGEDGCIMLERAETGDVLSEEVDIDHLFEKMKQSIDTTSTMPTCKSSDVAKLHAKGIGTVSGRLLVGTAEKIPSSELVDTTGAGDAFVGAVLYSLCANLPPEKNVDICCSSGSYWVQGVRSKSWSSSSERLSLETLFSVEDQRCCLVSMFAGNRSNGYDDSGYFLVSFSVLILFFVFWFRF